MIQCYCDGQCAAAVNLLHVTSVGVVAGVQVVAHMSETYWTAANSRLTRIVINGVMVQDNIDSFALTGGRFGDGVLVSLRNGYIHTVYVGMRHIWPASACHNPHSCRQGLSCACAYCWLLLLHA